MIGKSLRRVKATAADIAIRFVETNVFTIEKAELEIRTPLPS